MDNIVIVRGQAVPDPSEIPMDLTKRNRDQPQDLRVRNGTGSSSITPNHKRERLESMVNHIRQCSTIRLQRSDIETDSLRARLNAPPVGRDNCTPDTSDTDNSGNGSPWRPEDIFYLSANSQSSPVQDLSIRRESLMSSSSTASAVSVDAKTAFWHRACLPWMTYYAQLVRSEAQKDENGIDDSPRIHQMAPESPPAKPVVVSAGRKRAPRALTGKHVKHGTGASPSTLMTLREKIVQRQNSQQFKTENRSASKKRKGNS